MARNFAKTLELEHRQAKVAKAVLDGETNLKKIAAKIGLPDTNSGRQLTHLALKKVRAEWASSRVRDFDVDFGREYQRLEREYSRWLRAWRKSCKRRRFVKRKYETHMTQAGVAAEPEILADDGTVIREAIPEKDAVYARVEVEVEVRYEETVGDARYAALVAKTSESIRDLLGLIDRSKDSGGGVLPVVGFVINPPAGYVPRGMVQVENQVIDLVPTDSAEPVTPATEGTPDGPDPLPVLPLDPGQP